MPSVINVGGSITGALCITVVAWGIRSLRAATLRPHSHVLRTQTRKHVVVSQYHAVLSPASLRLLIELEPFLHYVLDLRPDELGVYGASPYLGSALRVPEAQLEAVLSSRSAWQASFGKAPPTGEHLLVLVTDSQEQGVRAAALAAALGYHRTATLAGGAAGWDALGNAAATDLQYLGRDALAALLGLLPKAVPGSSAAAAAAAAAALGAVVIDLRRADERILFGNIPETVHLPVEQLASALALPLADFKELYGFDRPAESAPVVLTSRTHRRASWAAQVCRDAGLRRVFVYRQGTYGWHFDASVMAYRRYERWEPPPEPEPFEEDMPNADVALRELADLGLLPDAGG